MTREQTMSQGTTERKCETLILLVGSNPLPNYLTATLLRPNKLVLIHTPETREPAERLNCVLGNHANIEMRGLAKASDAREIAEAIRGIISDNDPQQVHLNYTGGTKIMAAHARMAFRENGGKDQNASYLNDGARRLLFDDGFAISLEDKDLGLTLDRVGKLHGCTMKPPFAKDEGGPTENDALAIAAAVAGDFKLAHCLYQVGVRFEEQKKAKNAFENPWEPAKLGLALSVLRVPDQGWHDNRFKAWWRFLKGDWLEVAVARWVRDATGVMPFQGIDWWLNDHQLEVDVAMVRAHRLYLISCTTDSTKKLCKSKLFEVAMRARQLGGDLARSAVVCLIDGQDSKGRYIDQLRGDVASVWEAPNKPEVFGLADLREWTGAAGSPNIDSLKRWLDS